MALDEITLEIAVQNLKLLPELRRLKIWGHWRHDDAEEGAGVEDECVVDAVRGEPAVRVGGNRQDDMRVKMRYMASTSPRLAPM